MLGLIGVVILALVCCCGGGFFAFQKFIADNPRTIASAAADRLADLPSLHLTGWVANTNGPEIKADVTITAAGKVSGTISDALAGKAELRSAPGWTRVRGDHAWWANRSPEKAKALAGRWVKPEPGTAFPVALGEQLNPRSIQTLVKNLASQESWGKAEEVTVGGRRLRQLTAGDWTLLVTSEDPHDLVYFSGPLLSGRTGFAYGHGPVHYRLAEGGAAQHPRASVAVEPQTPAEQRKAEAAIDEVKRTESAKPLAEATPQPAPAALRATVQLPSLCLSPTCAFSVTVTNAGGSPGSGTLHVTVSTGQALPSKPIKLAPDARSTHQFQFRNPAPPSQGGTVRVSVNITAYVHTAELDGSDPAVAKRLRERGVDTTPLTRIGEPYGSIIVRAVDLMTQGTRPTDRAATLNALKAARKLVSTNSLPAFAEIIRHSGRLQNRADLTKLINDIGQDNDPTSAAKVGPAIGHRRVLEEVAQVLRDDPKARIAWDTYVDIAHGGKTGRYKADYLRLDTREAYQIKTVWADSPTRQHEAIEKRIKEAAAQLNGTKGAPSNLPPEKAPPGYTKVAKLRLEHQMGSYFLMNREELVQVLRRVGVYPKVRDGQIDRLEIVNGFNGGTKHVWTTDQLRRDLG